MACGSESLLRLSSSVWTSALRIVQRNGREDEPQACGTEQKPSSAPRSEHDQSSLPRPLRLPRRQESEHEACRSVGACQGAGATRSCVVRDFTKQISPRGADKPSRRLWQPSAAAGNAAPSRSGCANWRVSTSLSSTRAGPSTSGHTVLTQSAGRATSEPRTVPSKSACIRTDPPSSSSHARRDARRSLQATSILTLTASATRHDGVATVSGPACNLIA
jgi:hypothetical protein